MNTAKVHPNGNAATMQDKRCSMGSCSKRVQQAFSGLFRRYGEFVARHPLPFMLLPLLVFGGLGFGLLAMDEETNLERVYFPMNSRALDDRQKVRDLFPNVNNQSYNPFSQSDEEKAATFIFKTKNNQNIFDAAVLSEIQSIVTHVKTVLSYTDPNSSQKRFYDDVCARSQSQCVVDGEVVFSAAFTTALAAGSVTYPFWSPYDLETSISGESVTAGGVLTAATVLRISFKLTDEAAAWLEEFASYASTLGLTDVEVAYETPDSLDAELDKGTEGDVLFFSLTITLCCTYASVVTAGGNCVSTRAPLAFAGILAAGLGIVGSMGLLTLCGVRFVNIVGVVPFLIIGIGVDDMFLIMSSWSEQLPRQEERDRIGRHDLVPTMIGRTLAGAAIGISITSITDFLAFAIGTVSVFRSVINFSLYAGVAVLFCFIANVTFFTACLAYKGENMYDHRHSYFCFVTKSKAELTTVDKKPKLYAHFFGGSPPENPREDESFCEKLPRLLLPKVFTKKLACVFVIVLFLGYLAAAIYGAVNLQQGLVLQNLVPESSYYHRYLQLEEEYFPTRVPIGFIVNGKVDYYGSQGDAYLRLLQQASDDSAIDPNFERCWLISYRASASYPSTPQDFVTNLQTFLAATPAFQPDVVIDGSDVTASRCYVYSKPSDDQYAMADLMARMRDIADESSLPVFAFHWAFVAYEQFLAVLPATLQLVGIAIAVMTVVTFIFMPDIRMTLLVVLTIVMILVGVFGFMYYWDLTLSSITMIHLVMCVGFSVDFSVHVCSAYLVSDRRAREERAVEAMTHAAGPILNGATSTLLGVILLVASNSYIFLSFFKIMLLVILFGMAHAVFFLPAVLTLVGPQGSATTPTATAEPNGKTCHVENGVDNPAMQTNF